MALMEPNRCPHLKCLPPGILWVQRLSQGTQSTGNSKAVQAVPMELLSSHLTMDPPNSPIVPVSSSEPLQRFLQCSPCLSHSHSPKPCTATFIPPSLVVGALDLQKQMEHANQQTGFSDSSSVHPMYPQAPNLASALLALPPSPCFPMQMQPAAKSGFAATSQPGPWLPFI